MKNPSVVLLGSKPGAAVALAVLLERGWDVRHVVVTKADAPSWVPGPALREVAVEAGIPVVLQRELPPSEVDFVISYMYRNRVRPAVLTLAERGALNFHAGPLPEFGGWAFYNLAILEDATEYGCTCHYMDEGFDTGPLLRVRRFPIVAADHTAVSLERLAQEHMMELFVDFCALAESGAALPVEPQDPARMRYLSREEFEELKRIPEGADAETIDRHARAFWYPPYKGATARLGEAEVEIVPELAKWQAAAALHLEDHARIRQAAREGVRR